MKAFRGRSSPRAPIAPTDDAPSGDQETLIQGDRLPSRVPSLFFTMAARAQWGPASHGLPQAEDPAAFARHHLRDRVRRIICEYDVLDVGAAQDAANASIGQWFTPTAGSIHVRGSASLTVLATDTALAEEHLRRERAGDLDRVETLRRITFLHRILADPDQRTVWWVDQYPNRISELISLKTQLDDLRPPREQDRDELRAQVVRFVDHLIAELRTPQQLEILIRTLVHSLQTLGQLDLKATAEQWLPATPPRSGDTQPPQPS